MESERIKLIRHLSATFEFAAFSTILQSVRKIHSSVIFVALGEYSFFWRNPPFLFTHEGFDGGQAKAKPYFENALSKFKTFKSATANAPNWGKEASNYFLSQIK